jgi:hypothetical protein
LADQYAASRKLLQLAGVSVRQHEFRRPVHLTLTNDTMSKTRLANDSSSSNAIWSIQGDNSVRRTNGSLEKAKEPKKKLNFS